MLNKTNSWRIPAVVLSALVFMANLSQAQEGKMKARHEKEMQLHMAMSGDKDHRGMEHMGMMRGEHGFFLGMKDKLGLSDEQASKLRALKSQTEKQMIRTKADLKILEIELHDLLLENKVNVKEVDSKIEKIGELRTEIQKVHIHTRLDARKILTPEQLEKLHQQKGKKVMHEKRMGRKHKPG